MAAAANATAVLTPSCPDALANMGPTSWLSNVMISVAIGIFLVVGTVGNVLTVATISSTTQLQTISNYFICSLCVSDLFSAIVCSPLWLYRRTWGFSQWNWGIFLCECSGLCEGFEILVSIFFVLSICACVYVYVYEYLCSCVCVCVCVCPNSHAS